MRIRYHPLNSFYFATNFLGHFLLVNLLMSKLNMNARVVNAISGGYMVPNSIS